MELQSELICFLIALHYSSVVALKRHFPFETLTFLSAALSRSFATTALGKIEAAGSSETSENLYYTTQHQGTDSLKTINYTDRRYTLRNSPIYICSHRNEQKFKHKTSRINAPFLASKFVIKITDVWSSSQSSWLQIHRSRVRFPAIRRKRQKETRYRGA
jgi:hypothetical protein